MSIFRLTIFLFVLSIFAFPLTYAAEQEKIDINSADAWVLAQKLEDIGEKKSIAIVEYREEHGLFKTIYELEKVYGIGKKTIEKNMDIIVAIIPKSDDGDDGSDDDDKSTVPSSS